MSEKEPNQEQPTRTVSSIEELRSLVEKSPEGFEGIYLSPHLAPPPEGVGASIVTGHTPKRGIYFKFTTWETPETEVLFHEHALGEQSGNLSINEEDVAEGRVQILEQAPEH